MTAFTLKATGSTAKAVRRAAHGRAEDALTVLRDEREDPVTAVHEARKDMKKLRATLKLVRPAMGEAAYRRESARFRDAGRALSDVRDAQVRAQTVDALAERFADDPPPGGWWAVRAALAGDDAAGDGELESLRERAAAAIAEGDEAVDDWPLDVRGFDLLRGGLERSYARGRRAYRAARDAPGDETLHEWRKRAKDLWYHLRLLRRSWPPVMEAVADEAHELSDRLGDDHDLAVLRAGLDDAGELLTEEQASHLRDLIAARREELQAEAFAYGARLYAESPKRFAARLERYWEAGRG
jgi:CHAD domain-containing protein